MRIILRRKELKNIKYYNRDQVLELPSEPKSWVYLLQQRFYKNWLRQYDQRIKTFPSYYLLLPRYREIKPLSSSTVLARVKEATQAAVGINISVKVLRKTCAVIHSTSSDASILATLGWSAQYCFNYTWMPRVYFQESKS